MADLISRNLSSATKAVVVAFTNDPDWMKICEEERVSLAAALRAAADQMRYTDQLGLTGFGGYTQAQDQILAIATELGAQ